jgi:hypothetical protein
VSSSGKDSSRSYKVGLKAGCILEAIRAAEPLPEAAAFDNETRS